MGGKPRSRGVYIIGPKRKPSGGSSGGHCIVSINDTRLIYETIGLDTTFETMPAAIAAIQGR